MQLAIKAHGQDAPIKIKRVTLLDDQGKPLGDLAVLRPLVWSGSAYIAWDERTAGQDVAASYLLSSPKWHQLTQGKRNAAGRIFQLRVTVTVGGRDRTLDKQAMIPLVLEPPAVT